LSEVNTSMWQSSSLEYLSIIMRTISVPDTIRTSHQCRSKIILLKVFANLTMGKTAGKSGSELSRQMVIQKAKWQLGSKCPSDNSTLKTSIASPILTPIGDGVCDILWLYLDHWDIQTEISHGVCDISVIVPWPLEHSHWDKEISSSVTFSGNLHFIPPRLIFLAFSSN